MMEMGKKTPRLVALASPFSEPPGRLFSGSENAENKPDLP